jgi:hypothetical protein
VPHVNAVPPISPVALRNGIGQVGLWLAAEGPRCTASILVFSAILHDALLGRPLNLRHRIIERTGLMRQRHSGSHCSLGRARACQVDRPLTYPTGITYYYGSFEIRTASSSNRAVFGPLSPLAVPLLLSSPRSAAGQTR